jgi:MFS family permease
MLTYGIITGLERLCMPVLFKEISLDLSLSTVSIGTIWGMDPLAGIFVGLPSGLLADRFGVKRTLTVICILAGVFCALRGLSNNFESMAATMFLFGLMAAMTPSIAPKTTAIWFERRQLGLTNALINISWSIGAMTATMTSATILSPLLGGWRNVLFLMGGPGLVVGMMWLFTGRDAKKNEMKIAATARVPLREALSRVIRIKQVWIYGLISITLWGANMGFIGYLPLYLRNIGWTTAGADGAITAYSGATTLGLIPMVIVANKLKSPKGVYFFSMVVTVINLALMPVINGSLIWLVIILCTFLRSVASPLANVLIFEIEGVGSTYGGTAIGLMTSLGMIGAFLAPPLGNSLVKFGPAMPFFFWAGLAALSLPLFLFLRKETVAKNEAIIQP